MKVGPGEMLPASQCTQFNAAQSFAGELIEASSFILLAQLLKIRSGLHPLLGVPATIANVPGDRDARKDRPSRWDIVARTKRARLSRNP
jgi:hypothetical protein